MAKEEAREAIKEAYGSSEYTDEIIKALEQESTTKNDCAEQNGCITCSLDDGDDCCRKLFEESMREPTVKNDSAVDCIVDVLGSYTDLDIPYKHEIAENILTKLSSVISIKHKGHWIYDYTTADGHRTYHCSECGCYLKPKHSESLNSFKWCSLCGADMRGEE